MFEDPRGYGRLLPGIRRRVATKLAAKVASLVLALVVVAVPISSAFQAAEASGVPYNKGDVFAGVGSGTIEHFSPTGALLDTFLTGLGPGITSDTGMAFDSSSNLYGTDFHANAVSKFDSAGNLLGTFGSGYTGDPESIVFDMLGNAYVGRPAGQLQPGD